MSNKNYIEPEIENFILKNTNIRLLSHFSNGGGKVKMYYNPLYDDFIKLNLKIMKYYNSTNVSENFEIFFQQLNTIKEKKLLSTKEIEKLNGFIESYEVCKEFKVVEDILKRFHTVKENIYKNLIKFEEEQKIKEIIENF